MKAAGHSAVPRPVGFPAEMERQQGMGRGSYGTGDGNDKGLSQLLSEVDLGIGFEFKWFIWELTPGSTVVGIER